MDNSFPSSPNTINNIKFQQRANSSDDIDNSSIQTNTIDENTNIHSKNTCRSYGPKQEEFKRWCCDVKEFEDGEIVNDEKLSSFLKEYVLPRGKINKKSDENGIPVPLGVESVLSYVKAMVDLYNLQKFLNINSYPHPRGPFVKAVLDTLDKPLKRKRKRDCCDGHENYENQMANMNQNIENLYTLVNNGFNSLMTMLQSIQTQLHAQHQQETQSHIESRNALADTLLQASVLVRQSGSVSRPGSSSPGVSNINTSDSTNDTSNPNNQPSNDVIQYKMDRSISNVNDVWREYTIGSTGYPPVKTLETEYKTKWRKSNTESKFFTNRSYIYREIEKIAKERNITCEEAANILETKRVELGASLDKLIKMLKKSAC